MGSATCANCSGAAGDMRAISVPSSRGCGSVDAVERRLAPEQDALDVGPGFAEESGRGLPRDACDVGREQHAPRSLVFEREQGIARIGRLDAIYIHRYAAETSGI